MTREYTTRRPTGLPSWPITLIAGAEKTGKSWACAEASGSDLIGRTLWIGAGEDDPDEYAAVPGADFEIVPHDGTYRDLLGALTWAAQQPPTGDRPNLIILDSATRLWDLLCGMAQAEANRRAVEKARRYSKAAPEGDVQISMDLWNTAKDRWGNCIDALRAHQGPSIVTARLEEVTVIDGQGKPTQDKTLKIKTEKSLPYDVGVVVEMPRRGEVWLCGVRSTRLQLPERTKVRGPWRVDQLWRDLGLHETVIGQRTHSGVQVGSAANMPQAGPRGVGVSDALVRFCAEAAAASAEQLTALRSRLDDARLRTAATAAVPRDLQDLAQETGLHTRDITVGQWLDVCHDYAEQEGVTLAAALTAARRARTDQQVQPATTIEGVAA